MKRFWRDVAVDPDHVVMLDDRQVRTPGRAPLALPTAALGEAVADEWRRVEGEIDPRAMPLTGLANAAIDRIAADLAGFAAGLSAYGESDLLCYRAEAPAELVDRQAAAWDPWIEWARTRYDVHLEATRGILHHAQPAGTTARLAGVVAAFDAFRLAGLTPIVTITGSLVLGLALIEQAADPDTLWRAAHVDENWQVERWGEDALAAEALAARRRDFDGGVHFLAAL